MPAMSTTQRFRFDQQGMPRRETPVTFTSTSRPALRSRRARRHIKAHATHTSAVEAAGRRALARALRDLDGEERGALIHAARAGGIEHGSRHEEALERALTDGASFGPARRRAVHIATLLHGFLRRRALLEGALTTRQVAELFGASRQTPLDRIKAGTLLGVRDRGDWRFPAWQFDPEGPDGIVTGLADVFASLPASPFRRAAWLSTPHPALGARPIDALRAGKLSRVLDEARSVDAV
jgi:excisionase family DNA binding protein